jgi:hypothetical protein
MSSSDQPGPSNPHDDSYDSDDEILDARIEQTLDSLFAPPPVQASDLADLQKRFDEQRLEQEGKQRNSSVTSRGHSSRRALLIGGSFIGSIRVSGLCWNTTAAEA